MELKDKYILINNHLINLTFISSVSPITFDSYTCHFVIHFINQKTLQINFYSYEYSTPDRKKDDFASIQERLEYYEESEKMDLNNTIEAANSARNFLMCYLTDSSIHDIDSIDTVAQYKNKNVE